MCRLLAIKNFNFNIHQELLGSFFILSESGKVLPGDPPGHKDGWGIGYYSGSAAKAVKSGNSASLDREHIFEILKKIGKSPVLIAHLRKSAWKNTSNERHAHPFVFKNMIFAHNGTIRDFQENLAVLTPEYVPAADAKDTEVFFRYIVQNSMKSIKAGLNRSVEFVKANNSYTALNLLLTNGKTLLALREHADIPGYADYYTLYSARQDNSSFICSERLAGISGWNALENSETQSF